MSGTSIRPRLGRIEGRDADVVFDRSGPARAGPPPLVRQVLPPVDWSAIGRSAPERLAVGARRPEDPLPYAEIVIVTWTSAEWFALDRVFASSDTAGDYADHRWRRSWSLYTRGAAGHPAEPVAGPLWGAFRLVRIVDRAGRAWRALLFKSNAHLAHPPWGTGLSAMLRRILEDTQAERLYTIGTAGGALPGQRLGDTVITDAARLELRRPENACDLDNGKVIRGLSWFPSTARLADVERSLLLGLDRVVTSRALARLFARLQAERGDEPGVDALRLDDLTSDDVAPGLLERPRVVAMPGVPLLTTDYFHIAGDDPDSGAYACLEMDDAIVAREAVRAGVGFACVRAVSNPLVPTRSAEGRPIAAVARADWSSLLYSSFGLFAAYHGAVATWATIDGEGDADEPVLSTTAPAPHCVRAPASTLGPACWKES